MKDNILRYVLVVSLLLNISLLGAAGYTHYKQSRQRMEAPFGYGCIPGQATPSGHYAQGPHLFQELSLKPEQTNIFQQKAVLFHTALNKKRQEVDRLSREEV